MGGSIFLNFEAGSLAKFSINSPYKGEREGGTPGEHYLVHLPEELALSCSFEDLLCLHLLQTECRERSCINLGFKAVV